MFLEDLDVAGNTSAGSEKSSRKKLTQGY